MVCSLLSKHASKRIVINHSAGSCLYSSPELRFTLAWTLVRILIFLKDSINIIRVIQSQVVAIILLLVAGI